VADVGVNHHRGLRGVRGQNFAHLLEVTGRGAGVFLTFLMWGARAVQWEYG
jgi:hypothetical protein